MLEHFPGTTGMKTGYICASGLNIVATVERVGRSLLAVVLGGVVGARAQRAGGAAVAARACPGRVDGTGQAVSSTLKNIDEAPVDMRPLICGKKAKDYVKQREAAFPMGLKGQPSYLTDEIEGAVYMATDLGKIVDVPLPRPRPDLGAAGGAAN